MKFDELLEKKHKLHFGEFNIFCREFGIPVSNKNTLKIFKKVSINHQPFEYDKFLVAIDVLAVEVNNEKIEKLEKRLKEILKLEKARAFK